MAVPEMEKHPLLEEQRDLEAPEPTLRELQQNVFKAQQAYMRAWSKTTSGKWQKRIMLAVTILLCSLMIFAMSFTATAALDDEPWHIPGRVPLEVHIMSKCPDARDCLHDMILPAMQNVSHKVDFKLSYIGQIAPDDDGVICKHGQSECLGNILELCAARYYPIPKQYLGFTMCLTKSYADIPQQELVEDCALEHGISMQDLNECAAADAEGSELLRESFRRSQEAGVQKSCTVRLNGTVRCVRDGGEWKDCDGGHDATDLVADITELWAKEREEDDEDGFWA